VLTISIIGAMNILIALMMTAVYTSETSVYLYETTRRYTSEGCLLQIFVLFYSVNGGAVLHFSKQLSVVY
jgi:hypothetical protein